MEQQQFKVRLSVGTKLLLSIVAILLFSITFLDFASILLLTKDQRAYTYQAQSTEANFVGREFSKTVQHTLETLKLVLTSGDPREPLSPEKRAAIDSLFKNQNEILAVSVQRVDPATGIPENVQTFSDLEEASKLGLVAERLAISEVQLKSLATGAKSDRYEVMNIAASGSGPLLAIAYADLEATGTDGKMSLAIGIVALKSMASDLRSSRLTIAVRDGHILFDTVSDELYGKQISLEDPLFKLATSGQFQSGASEFEQDGEKHLGSYSKPGFDTVVLARTDLKRALRATYTLIEKFILIGLVAIGIAVIFGILFSKTMTAPLKRLYLATQEIAKGNFDTKLVAHSRDEIGALTQAFTWMGKQISELIGEKLRKVQLENELAIASTVQQTLLPSPKYQDENLLIHSLYQSASECGGDWWGFFKVGDKFCVMIADATGHGLPSALITAAARSCFSVIGKLAQEDPRFDYSPQAMLKIANRAIHEAASGKILMTFFAGVLDLSKGEMTYASAGHNPPWLFKNSDGSFTLKSLTAVGKRLGEEPDSAHYEEKKVEFAAGDIFFLYTDGLLEDTTTEGEQYGKKRARKAVEHSLAKGPEAVLKTVHKELLDHNGPSKPFDDDVTLVVIQVQSLASDSSRTRTDLEPATRADLLASLEMPAQESTPT